jgi:hypothetical protein
MLEKHLRVVPVPVAHRHRSRAQRNLIEEFTRPVTVDVQGGLKGF